MWPPSHDPFEGELDKNWYSSPWVVRHQLQDPNRRLSTRSVKSEHVPAGTNETSGYPDSAEGIQLARLPETERLWQPCSAGQKQADFVRRCSRLKAARNRPHLRDILADLGYGRRQNHQGRHVNARRDLRRDFFYAFKSSALSLSERTLRPGMLRRWRCVPPQVSPLRLNGNWKTTASMKNLQPQPKQAPA